jgi:hypothetical protein
VQNLPDGQAYPVAGPNQPRTPCEQPRRPRSVGTPLLHPTTLVPLARRTCQPAELPSSLPNGSQNSYRSCRLGQEAVDELKGRAHPHRRTVGFEHDRIL